MLTKTQKVRVGYCVACPYDVGSEATEIAYNLGCLPHTGEIARDCERSGKAWACHSEPGKICCGYAAQHRERIDLPRLLDEGVHGTAGRQALAAAKEGQDPCAS